MAVYVDTLITRYLEFCKIEGVLPNSAVLSGFIKAQLQQSLDKLCSLQVFLDELTDVDLPPLIKIFREIDSSEINAVDIGSRGVLKEEYAFSLILAITQKFRVVDIRDFHFEEAFVRDLLCVGFPCQILKLRCFQIQKLDMSGNFMQLHTLNLDFSTSLTSFHENCFKCMPNLMCVSMCETRVSNLWTTTAALSKLPSLVELRFQNCLCCNDTGPCSTSSSENANSLTSDRTCLDSLDMDTRSEIPSVSILDLVLGNAQNSEKSCSHEEETLQNIFLDNLVDLDNTLLESATNESSNHSDVDFPSLLQRTELEEPISSFLPELSRHAVPENKRTSGIFFTAEEGRPLVDVFDCIHTLYAVDGVDRLDGGTEKYRPHHPSPICFEKHYREYIVASLPRLKVLDNLLIKDTERKLAKVIFSQFYEFSPYNRQRKANLVSVLQKREIGANCHLPQSSSLKQAYPIPKSQYLFSRSICAAKVGSSSWPLLHPIPKLNSTSREESTSFRPRQFEYHPSDLRLMVFGTLDGEIVVVNHENGELVGHTSSRGIFSSVLGLSWLRRNPSKLIVGSENGSLQLYDICQLPSTNTEKHGEIVTFGDFEQLTSVHVNSTDEHFIASGYSKKVALYDINSGKRLQIFTDMHQGKINVVKFSNHSPSIFATASFDRDIKMWDLRQRLVEPCYTTSSSRGNVMVCFSPDDHYLLASSVDNEVKQLLAVDGRVHMKFEIASTGSSQNYTRSYYMNGRDYIISGSSDEYVVRICCTQTGRRLRDVSLEDRSCNDAIYVHSLRGDPFRDFHMSVLAAYTRPSSKSEIIKINLMASSSDDHEDVYPSREHSSYHSFGMAG